MKVVFYNGGRELIYDTIAQAVMTGTQVHKVDSGGYFGDRREFQVYRQIGGPWKLWTHLCDGQPADRKDFLDKFNAALRCVNRELGYGLEIPFDLKFRDVIDAIAPHGIKPVKGETT